MNLLELLDRPIAFHRIFIKLTGSIYAALMLSQAFYWAKRTEDTNGWFYKTREEWEAETGLNRYAQETARELLRKTGFWFEDRRGVPCQLYFRIDLQTLANQLANQKENLPPTRRLDDHQLDGESATNLMAKKPPTLNKETETTTEITTETTAEKKSDASRVPRSAAAPKIPKSFVDENWLDYFRSKKVWAGIDIERVKEKMEAWCEVHGKKPSPRRLVSWLNSEDGEAMKKADEPLSPQELVIVEVCALELPLTATQRKEVRDCAAFMREHQATTGRLKREATEYWHRWERPGEPHRDPPRPSQLCEKWSAFVEWEKKHPAKLEGASPKERCPKCYGLGRVKSIPGEIDSPKVPCPVCSPQPAQAPPKGDLAA